MYDTSYPLPHNYKFRFHSLFSLFLMLIALYGYLYLADGIKSFEHKNSLLTQSSSIIPLILFLILRFCTTGIVLVPFMLLSELFPFKSRCFASGVTAATNYISMFCATKSFYNIEDWLSLPTALLLYASVGLVG